MHLISRINFASSRNHDTKVFFISPLFHDMKSRDLFVVKPRHSIQCIQDNRMPDTRKSISLILAAMQAYYESIGKKAPLTDKDLMYHMTAAEMGTAVGTIIGLYIEANKSPQGEVDEQEKMKEADDSKNA
jgi:hypothetical protein